MGRLTAQLLLDRGADVTVTIRQYRSGIVDVPVEAARIDYSKRYEKLPECRYVFRQRQVQTQQSRRINWMRVRCRRIRFS